MKNEERKIVEYFYDQLIAFNPKCKGINENTNQSLNELLDFYYANNVALTELTHELYKIAQSCMIF